MMTYSQMEVQPEAGKVLFTMKRSEIAHILEADVLTGKHMLDREIKVCVASDLMSDILAGLYEECLLLTGLTTIQTIKTAIIADVGAVVFVRKKSAL